jgi:hypothetical protein
VFERKFKLSALMSVFLFANLVVNNGEAQMVYEDLAIHPNTGENFVVENTQSGTQGPIFLLKDNQFESGEWLSLFETPIVGHGSAGHLLSLLRSAEGEFFLSGVL